MGQAGSPGRKEFRGMKTELMGQEKNVVKIKVQFEAAEFDKGLKQTLKALSQEMNIPGFRKGHAPRSVIEMRIGRDALYNEVFERLFSRQLPQIYEDYDLDPIDSPEMTPDEVHEGSDVTCTLEVEVMPEVELPDLGEIEVEKVRISVDDDDVTKAVRDISKNFAKTQPVTRPVAEGDVVGMTITISVVGEENSARAPQKNLLDLGDPDLRAELRSALIGHSVGETVEAEFDLEDDHENRSIAGKRLHYSMLVETVFEREMPELSADFFKKLYGDETSVTDEASWREKLRADLTAQAQSEADTDASSRALDLVAKQAKVELPETMVRRQAIALRERDEKEAKERFNSTLKDVLSDGREDWAKDYAQVLTLRAEGMVRRSLTLGAIADANNVSVDQADIDREMDRRAAVFGVDRKRVAAMFYKDRSALENLADRIRLDKAAEIMMSQVKVKEVDKLTPPAAPAAEGDAAEGAGA